MSATEVERLARRAGFVFAGEVVRTGASTMELVEPTKETAVVRVERVLSSPDDLGAVRGSEVTVRLQSPAKKGQRAVFFTVGWIAGDGLAVQEVGRQPAGALEEMEKQMRDVGRKGDVKEGQRLRVAYASSRDVMWFRAPKPEPGDRAVFLLHQHELPELNVEMLAILEPLDVQPVERLDEIRRAI